MGPRWRMLGAAGCTFWPYWAVIVPSAKPVSYMVVGVLALVINTSGYRWAVVLLTGGQIGMYLQRESLLRSPLGTVLYCGLAALLFCLILWVLALGGTFRDPAPTRVDTTGTDTSVVDSPSEGGMAP